MRAFALKRTKALLAVVVATTGLVLASSAAVAAPVTIDLCAVAGTTTVTGSVTVPIWGFALNTGDCSTVTATLPGPVLDVAEGDVVTLNITNALPAGHPLQLEIPGITLDPGAVDGSAPITFTVGEAGSYLYQSAGDAGRQTAMGLYGALIVRPATAGQAYDDASSAYDVEATLVLSQVDLTFNANPDTFDMKDYLATYWLINGKAYPDTAAISAVAGDDVLLRLLNGGYDNTSMSLLGTHMRVIARSARFLDNQIDAAAETIPAGGTEDAIVTVPAFDPPNANGFPLFNRNLHVTNGSGLTYATPGGMLTFIDPT
jgi:FtsP/CotA-like multicopper oxidase with cupredoxin domain